MPKLLLQDANLSLIQEDEQILDPRTKTISSRPPVEPVKPQTPAPQEEPITARIRSFFSQGKTPQQIKDALGMMVDTATDPEQWKALGQIVQTGREQVGNLPGIKQAREFLTPESDEEARRSGLIKIGNSYVDPMGISSLERAGSKAVAKGAQTLTTRFLEYLKGKKTVSRQEVLDFANRPELKKGEADLLNSKIQDFTTEKLPAQDFADSIRRDLLELKPVRVEEPQYKNITISRVDRGRYMPSDVKNLNNLRTYEEVVFESPITTNGSSHFPNSKNYFAHARGDEVVEGGKKIWREQEIQSDLLQKEGLERLKKTWNRGAGSLSFEDKSDYVRIMRRKDAGWDITKADDKRLTELQKKIEKMREEDIGFNKTEEDRIAPLYPFTNDRFGERIMRERIREKAAKGYEKYRLPTGETIGKIEGFTQEGWTMNNQFPASPADLKVGEEIWQTNGYMGATSEDGWIITDVLGDGRFKAVMKRDYDQAMRGELTAKGEKLNTPDGKRKALDVLAETFDLTGKSNPQYRRYEQWGKFLKNKYGAKQVTDPQGNSWYEIDLKPEYATDSVLAFGKTNVGTMATVGGGIAATAAAPILAQQKTYNIDLSKPEAKIEEPQKQETAQLRKAILLNETSVIPEEKRYSYRRHSNQPGLGYANGAYQVTDGELKAYSDDLLGRVVTPKEFLASPELQDAYMDAKIQRLRDKGYSDEEILGIHFGGINADLSSSVIQDYIKKGLEKLKLVSAQAAEE